MLSHQRHPRGNQLVKTYMERDFRVPKDFASFLYLSQVLQATEIVAYSNFANRLSRSQRAQYALGRNLLMGGHEEGVALIEATIAKDATALLPGSWYTARTALGFPFSRPTTV